MLDCVWRVTNWVVVTQTLLFLVLAHQNDNKLSLMHLEVKQLPWIFYTTIMLRERPTTNEIYLSSSLNIFVCEIIKLAAIPGQRFLFRSSFK